MESLSFPGGKHVGIEPSSRPSRSVAQAINLGMLFHAADFMVASHRICRVADEHRKNVARVQSERDRQAYLNKCYPQRFFQRHSSGHMFPCERLSNGHVIVSFAYDHTPLSKAVRS